MTSNESIIIIIQHLAPYFHFVLCISVFQVAVLGDCNPEVQEIAYQYGRNIGMAFQVELLLLFEERRVLFRPATKPKGTVPTLVHTINSLTTRFSQGPGSCCIDFEMAPFCAPSLLSIFPCFLPL